MNKIYNLIWSRALRCLVVVAERVTDGRGKGGRRVVRTVALGAFGIPVIALAQGPLPTGGQIVSGTGAIATNGNAMTITQSSGRLITNWNSFSIGAGNSVTFKQPGASSVALNRVTGQDPSQILGSLTSNGQVFLVNPNGIVFGNGARVRTGAFVASTLGISDQDFLSGHYRFTNGAGAGSSIVNQGTLSGDVVALMSPSVVNEGTITGSPGGGVALAAGSDVLLDFDGDGLLSVQVNASTMQTLAENRGLIATDGGTALLTAKGASDALKGVVNNTGTIEAHTIANQGGRILLLGDMAHGETQVDGKLDASAPGSGDGGYIETSAHKVSVADSAQITTQASNGKTGTWLIDPNDFTIAASGGDMTGAALSNQLASSNVEVQSGTAATVGNGDIFVNDVVTWATNKLTLHAVRNIVVDSTMNGSGTAGLALEYGQGAAASRNTAAYVIGAPVNLGSLGSFSTKFGFDGTTVRYTIIADIVGVQGMQFNLAGNYVLAANVDARTAFSLLHGPVLPIGSASASFNGVFDGLGHTISHLSINQLPTTYGGIFDTGLFGYTGSTAIIRDVGLVGGTVSGGGNVCALAGVNHGTVINAYDTTTVSGNLTVGGLIGLNYGTVSSSYAAGSVNGVDGIATIGTVSTVIRSNAIGGLVGENDGTLINTYAAGSVTGNVMVGGLIGHNTGAGTVTNSYAAATFGNSANTGAGGLIGACDFSPCGRSVTASFFDADTAPSSAWGTAASTAQLQNPFTFIDAGWDFSAVWGKSQAGANNGNMVLRSLDNTVYNDYVRPESVSSIYGSNSPVRTSVVLDGVGASNVSVSAGSAIGLHASVGTYAYSAGNTIAITDAAGRSLYLDYGSGALTITPAVISGITGIAASNKTYDGTTTVALNTASAVFTGLVSGDTLTVANSNGAFSDKNAGMGKTVNISGLSLGGADAGNYTLANTSATATADIAKATIAAVTGITANDKTYDGTTAATLNLGGANFTGMITGDHLTVATATGAFGDSSVGAAKTVSIAGLSLGGADAGNYTLANDTAITVANIDKVLTPTPPATSPASSTGPAPSTGPDPSTSPASTTGWSLARSSTDPLTSAALSTTPAPPLMPDRMVSAEINRSGTNVSLTTAPPELIDVSGIMPVLDSPNTANSSLHAAGCSASNAQGGVSSCSR